MRIVKSSTLVCAVLLCAAISVQAQDNAAQAAARAALMQKMQEMDQQGDNNNNNDSMPVSGAQPQFQSPTTPAKKSKAAKSRTTTVVTQAPARTTTTVQTTPGNAAPIQTFVPAANEPYTPNQDNAAQTTARAALMERMHELDLQDMNTAAATPPAPGNQTVGLPGAVPVVVSNTPAEEPFFEPAPQMSSAPQSAMPTRKRTFTPFQHEGFVAPVDNFGFAPVQAPAAPVSPEKEVELHALLAKYRADLITPSEYQAERARILSGP